MTDLPSKDSAVRDKWKIVDGDCREGSTGLITYHVSTFDEGYKAAIASKQEELSSQATQLVPLLGVTQARAKELERQLAQAEETISTLEARIDKADKKAEAESNWYVCSELPDRRLQYTQDNENEEYAVQLFTRPPITSQRELKLLEVIEQMREALNDLTGVCITQVGADYNDTIHAAYLKGKDALALTPDISALKEHSTD